MVHMFGAYKVAFYRNLKRVIDVVVSLFLMIFLLPVYLAIFIAVKATSKGEVIFWSERIGLDGKAFKMPKFRSMTSCSKVVSREQANGDDFCLTPIGNFLRKTSLDEIPQLWSVLVGHMSLIGPRPLLGSDQVSELRKNYPEIYSVRPGITGLAQVNGRSYISPRNKRRYDSFYSQRACIILDTRILIRTVAVVLNPRHVM